MDCTQRCSYHLPSTPNPCMLSEPEVNNQNGLLFEEVHKPLTFIILLSLSYLS